MRLRDTVEAFPASDGHLYLLRGGSQAELIVRDAEARVLALFELLAENELTVGELLARMRAQGHRLTRAELTDTLERLKALRVIEHVARPDGRLSREQLARFSRQLPYLDDHAPPGLDGVAAQQRLAAATVLIIGCGGLGSWAMAALACAGVGGLVLVDDDSVELSNLNRQLLYRACDVGRPKVEAAAEALQAFNPHLRTVLHHRRVASTADVEALLDGVDLVIETADSPIYEISRWINRACVSARVAHISAGQFPPTIRVGPLFVPGETACLECQEQDARRTFSLYDELIAYRQRRVAMAATLGPASGLIGSVLGMEALHHLTGLCEPATRSRALVVDLKTLATRLEPVARIDGCTVCG